MLALATLLLLTAPTAEAKGKPGRKSKKTEAAAEKADTTKKEKKGYEELLKGAVTDKGMFDVHRKGTDFLFEIPDSLMGSGRTLSVHMYSLWSEGLNTDQSYATAVVLLVIVASLNALSSAAAKRLTGQKKERKKARCTQQK